MSGPSGIVMLTALNVNMNFGQTRRVIVAGIIGNVLEWYDFAVYGFFATAIGQEFFPHQDRVAQLLSAFGVFALGYLMRPLGGAVTGHIGGLEPALRRTYAMLAPQSHRAVA